MDRDKTLSKFYGLIRYLAKSYYDKTLPKLKRVIAIDDLFMEGVIGAIKAIDNFDKDKGTLASWVTLKARGQVLDSIIELSGIPKREWTLISKIIKAEEKLSQILDKPPSDTEIAEYAKLPVEKVEIIRSWFRDWLDIDTVTVTEKQRGPHEYHELITLSEAINKCIQSTLTAEEGFVLIERIIYELEVKEISEIIKRDTPTAYRIEARAKRKVRQCLMNKGWSEEDFGDILH